jgi:hypothetical protein
VKINIITAAAAAAIAAAGITVGAVVPRPVCEDGARGTVEFTYPGREPVALPMGCFAGQWVIDPTAQPRQVEGAGE